MTSTLRRTQPKVRDHSKCVSPSVWNHTVLLRYNLTDRNTILQNQLLYWTASNVLNKERLLNVVQYLSLINLIKPSKFYIPAHHRHNLSEVLRNKRPSAVILSWYNFQNIRRSIHKMLWNIPEAYITTILVLLHNKCVTKWNVVESFTVCKSAWLSRLEISRSKNSSK